MVGHQLVSLLLSLLMHTFLRACRSLHEPLYEMQILLSTILKLPEEVLYNRLKEQFIKHKAVSEQRKLQQLFSSEELGDHKPTHLTYAAVVR